MTETKIWLEFEDPRMVKRTNEDNDSHESLHQVTERLTSDYNSFLGRLGIDQQIWWYEHKGHECWAIGNNYGFTTTEPKCAGKWFLVNYLALDAIELDAIKKADWYQKARKENV
jgi:hypothetical protein|tara:strand:- start:139 stop:480 length:342 start_codon:yes stop_codon:yes gene_type:complete